MGMKKTLFFLISVIWLFWPVLLAINYSPWFLLLLIFTMFTYLVTTLPL